ncbi:putative protein N(5)-glutamine methyltransferase [Arthrobacter sp. UYP6]|uniref:putative protein N(5)-glutamine methyltransferase n=1 Tax=Arthrobacter sp. UYP6 TaxID=1756378 RepID=UPI0033985434
MHGNITEESLTVRLRAAGCVFAEEEARLLLAEAGSPDILEHMVFQRTTGLPLEQILGWAEFYGLRISVSPGVFIPRRRTELLAEHALVLISQLTSPVVVELCAGSGAVSAALAAHRELPLEAYAVELQPAAVECARLNLTGRATVLEGDLFLALPDTLRGRIDVVVANAPYVPTAQLGTMPPEARDYEPALTLDGGADGLDVLRRIIVEAPRWLRPGGSVLVECSRYQAETVGLLMAIRGLHPETLSREDPEATIVVGQRAVGTAAAQE